MTTTTVPGIHICGCGEYASVPHACEYRPAARQVRLCECGEYTYSPQCAGPCRLPDDEIPPMPPTAITVRVAPGDECAEWVHPDYRDFGLPEIRMGVATRGRRSR